MNKVSVIGVGKLGLCWALELEKNGYDVLGVDLSQNYVNSLNDKTFNSSEASVNDLLKSSNNFRATTDIKESIDFSDVIFIVVATPSLKDGRYNHQYLDSVIDSIVENSNDNSTKHIVVCCTTMPGHCNKLKDKIKDSGYTLSYNPEFIAQGSIIRDMENPDIVLIGEDTEEAGDIIEEINLSIAKNNPKVFRMSSVSAEITKISLNCYVTMKIAFANSIGDLCIESGAEYEKVLEAIGNDSRVGNKYFKYGYGYGGPCFPRDNRALGIFSKDMDREVVFSRVTDISNKIHLHYQIQDFVKKNPDKNKEVVIDFVTYKKDSVILEESQQLLFALELKKLGYKIKILDDRKEVLNQIKSLF